jgi:serine protease inhibitor
MKSLITLRSLLIIITPFLFITSCKKESSENLPVDPVPISLSTDQISMIESGNSFAFDIFKSVTSSPENSENIIISPLSISTALSMTLNGASGATRDSMLKALRYNNITPENINKSFSSLSSALLSVDKRVLISIANSVWTENNFVVKKPFTDILTNYYNAEAKSFNVTDPLAPKQMNKWIEANTNGLIKNMISELDPNTVMLLINAIYFKGKWKSQFDASKTINQTFYKTNGTTNQVPMMKHTADFKTYKGDSFVLAELPYGQGNFVIDVLLPDSRTGINDVLSKLNDVSFRNWTDNMRETETVLSLPRFKYGYKKELKEILSGMGMGIAFTDEADFSNISNLDLLISFILHQAFIETNEEGTEAAAATVVGIITTSMPIRFEMNIDHPFIYIIRETSTNSILFMGKVEDPLAN